MIVRVNAALLYLRQRGQLKIEHPLLSRNMRAKNASLFKNILEGK